MVQFLGFATRRFRNVRFNKQGYLQEYVLNQNGEAVVLIYLEQIQAATSKYSGEEFKTLDQELIDYMDRLIYHIPLKYSLVVCFVVKDSTSEQKELVTDMIKRHYGLLLEDKRHDLKINFLIILGLFLIGVALLTFSYYLSAAGMEQLLTDTINIAGTFALWEMIDLYLLDRKVRILDQKNAAQTYSAKIVFQTQEEHGK